MIITNAGNEEAFRHYADGRVYWISPFASEQEVDYSDAWEEPRRMQGQCFEETMPPADNDAAQAILDDGQLIPGVIRTTGFSETKVKKQFVSLIKLLPQFQSLVQFNGAIITLAGRVVRDGPTIGNFAGFCAINFGDYALSHSAETSGYLADPCPGWTEAIDRYLFAAKITLPIYGSNGELLRTDVIYYPLKNVNEAVHDIYTNYYTRYDITGPSGAVNRLLLPALLDEAYVSFDATALGDLPSLYKIVKDYCTAIGLTLRIEIEGGGYVWNSNAKFTAYSLPLPLFDEAPFLPEKLGENSRLIGTSGKVLAGQRNKVMMAGIPVWSISQNDPLLQQEVTIAETDAVVFGDLANGAEYIVNQSGSDDWASCHTIGYHAIRSPLWPQRLFSMLGAWNVSLEAHHFSFNLDCFDSYFQYENWLMSLRKVERQGSRYLLDAVAFVAFELQSGSGDWRQIVMSQSLMLPIANNTEFIYVLPLRGGAPVFFAQLSYPFFAPTQELIVEYAEENERMGEDVGIQVTTLQANMSCYAALYTPIGRTRYYVIDESGGHDYRVFEPLPPGEGVIFAYRNGSRFVDFHVDYFSAGSLTIDLVGEYRYPLNIIVSSATDADPVITYWRAGENIDEPGHPMIEYIDNLSSDYGLRFNVSFLIRGEMERIRVDAYSATITFVLENPYDY